MFLLHSGHRPLLSLESHTYTVSSFLLPQTAPLLEDIEQPKSVCLEGPCLSFRPHEIPAHQSDIPILILSNSVSQIFEVLALSHLHSSSPHYLYRVFTIWLSKPHSSPGCSKLLTLCAFPIPHLPRPSLVPFFSQYSPQIQRPQSLAPGTCLSLPIHR